MSSGVSSGILGGGFEWGFLGDLSEGVEGKAGAPGKRFGFFCCKLWDQLAWVSRTGLVVCSEWVRPPWRGQKIV